MLRWSDGQVVRWSVTGVQNSVNQARAVGGLSSSPRDQTL